MQRKEFEEHLLGMDLRRQKMAYRIFASVYLSSRELGSLELMRKAARTLIAMKNICGFSLEEIAELMAQTKRARETRKQLSPTILTC